MSQPPPRGQDAKGEGRDPASKDGGQLGRFCSLTTRLLRVKREEVEEAEREYQHTKGGQQHGF